MSTRQHNQVMIVFDSLRYDVFRRANLPFMKGLGQWKRAMTPGTYTLPAHMSFFVGKLPQTLDGTDYYDTVAGRFDRKRGYHRDTMQLWRLGNPEAPRPARYTLEGSNIIEGFRRIGYRTIGTGAVNWFNPELPAARCLTEHFEELKFFGHTVAEEQIAWSIERVRAAQCDGVPYFLFLNFGETHHPFRYKGCAWGRESNPYGDARKCKARQRACIEFIDGLLPRLFDVLTDYELVMCADHGEALGEKGAWGHGFGLRPVIEVPLLIARCVAGCED